MSYVDARLIDQYRDSPKVVALLKALVDGQLDELNAALAQLKLRLSIDAMSGVQLDLIGQLIGLPRPPSIAAESEYLATTFAYKGESDGLGYTTGMGISGGEYVAPQDFVSMQDADYRLFLKAKAIKNNSLGTVFDIEKATKIIYGEPRGVVEQTGHVIVSIPFELGPLALGTLRRVIPKADGVKLTLTTLPLTVFRSPSDVRAYADGSIFAYPNGDIFGYPESEAS